MKTVDLLVIHAKQLITCANDSQPKRGKQMRDVGIIDNGALAIHEGQIVAIGKTSDIQAEYQSDTVIDASGKSVIPGLVDCHTHTVFAGNRLDEFEMRIQGKSYMDIMNAGGGIRSTVKATREASLQDLIDLAQDRLNTMLQLGITTVEIKTGYGLSDDSEQKMMQAILDLAENNNMTIVPTYLGAHAIPEEYDSTDDYLASLYEGSLRGTQQDYKEASLVDHPMFVDIFVEENVFTVDNMRDLFTAAKERGLYLKAHVDEFVNLGAVPVAVDMGATSVDHLDVTPESELEYLAQSDTVGVMLPAVNFNLGSSHFANARHLIDSNGILALSTDYNPGSAPTMSLPMVMAIACRYQKLLPSEALNASTINAATALKLEQKVGSLEVGKQGDFLILNTDDYRTMVYEFGHNLVEQVIIKGEIVWNAS